MVENVEKYLEQARCPQELCKQVARLAEDGRGAEALPALAEHRMALLAESRDCNQRLDCLDHAIHLITCGS